MSTILLIAGTSGLVVLILWFLLNTYRTSRAAFAKCSADDNDRPSMYRKYSLCCPRCGEYFPVIYNECPTCKITLIDAGRFRLLMVALKICIFIFILAMLAVGSYHAWRLSTFIKMKLPVRAHLPKKMVDPRNDFIKDNASDVLELNNGDVVIGKITGEAKGTILFKEFGKNGTEYIVQRKNISKIRKITLQEARSLEGAVSMEYVTSENERIERGRIASMAQRMVAAPTLNESSEDLEGRFVENGMSKAAVAEILGRPDDVTVEQVGYFTKETWHYRGGKSVTFKNERVVSEW